MSGGVRSFAWVVVWELMGVGVLLRGLGITLHGVLGCGIRALNDVLSLTVNVIALTAIRSFLRGFHVTSVGRRPCCSEICGLQFSSVRGHRSRGSVHVGNSVMETIGTGKKPHYVRRKPCTPGNVLANN